MPCRRSSKQNHYQHRRFPGDACQERQFSNWDCLMMVTRAKSSSTAIPLDISLELGVATLERVSTLGVENSLCFVLEQHEGRQGAFREFISPRVQAVCPAARMLPGHCSPPLGAFGSIFQPGWTPQKEQGLEQTADDSRRVRSRSKLQPLCRARELQEKVCYVQEYCCSRT
jgi:hypothetical protein